MNINPNCLKFIIIVEIFIIILELLIIFSAINLNLVDYYHIGGILSGIFAFAAFIVAYGTIRHAKKESKLQQKYNDSQMQNSIDQLDLAKEELAIQEKSNKIERFQNMFFHLLQFHQNIVNSLKIGYSEFQVIHGSSTIVLKTAEGRDCFEKVYKKIVIVNEVDGFVEKHSHVFDTDPFRIKPFYESTSLLTINRRDKEITVFNGLESVLNIFGINGYENCKQVHSFDHYFRSLYRVFKFIGEEESKKVISESEGYEYAALVRGTLSPYELVFLFYNGLAIKGEKFKPLIEKYCILKNLREDLLTYSHLTKNNDKEDEVLKDSSGNNPSHQPNDFIVFQTHGKNIRDKYYLSAFYRGEKLLEAIEEARKTS